MLDSFSPPLSSTSIEHTILYTITADLVKPTVDPPLASGFPSHHAPWGLDPPGRSGAPAARRRSFASIVRAWEKEDGFVRVTYSDHRTRILHVREGAELAALDRIW